MAAKAPAELLDVDGIEVRLSSPDKIYFPKLGSAGGTKRHLVDYYRAIATLEGGGIMTALRDRPTHLQRFPDGIEGEEIYQKRVPAKRPEHIGTCRVTNPNGRTADALRVRHPADVVWAAQMGNVTFHPWPVRCVDTDRPDELRIDLDPQPGTGFAQARAVALEIVRPLLDELGLVGYPKTSGGRGIHVYVRIEPRWDFVEVRRSAIALAREIERRGPDLVTTAWWKEERGERIFVDFNQTARDKTIASAYSVRKTPSATVSTPVTWAELPDVEPDDFTIATVPELVGRRGDPMADIDAVAHSLDVLLEMSGRDETAGLGDMPYPPQYPKMPGEPKRVQPSRDRDRREREK
ncbi:DNA polymerase domain-containing protein [Rhodococcus sp. D2-41]|uniref:DNA polymerase domain-containing protein n=1 Tax=Speluncibacter jeojiensis TaxID=2710754 RepID=UPI0024105C17|nr:DNA polymerase domain-containing protein [Rhodococcus sp. D2-41]MDG3009552.1 DNA polymerase domain-containing protein [Rhodococcus sp. D2-41]